MKRIVLILAFLAVCGVAFGEDEKDRDKAQCPKTLMKSSCFSCHSVPSFKLKETPPDSQFAYPIDNMRISDDTAYYVLENIKADLIQSLFNYVKWHPDIKRVIIEIHSPGGSLFDAHKIVGLMQHMEGSGYIVETRVYGFAASAGFLIAASGTKGHRLVSSTAQMMWHELISFSMFSVESPSDSEEKARVLRHLQDTANKWLSERSNLTVEQINEKIKKKEFWINGKQAIECGFADGELK